VIEALQGGFSASQLWMTLVAEAVIPVFVGRPVCSRATPDRVTGRTSGLAYAYSYVFFTATVVYAHIDRSRD
jgi:hypothetical protein